MEELIVQTHPGASVEYLEQALIARLTDLLAEVRMPCPPARGEEPTTEEGDPVALKIVRGMFDPSQIAEYDPPAVMVWAGECTQGLGDDGEELRTAAVEITLIVYRHEHGDDEYMRSVLERIQQDLLARRVLDRRYRVRLPVTFSAPPPNDQPWPFCAGSVSATYSLPAITEVTDEADGPLTDYT